MMIVPAGASLEVYLAGAVATTQPAVSASWSTLGADGSAADVATNDGTAVEIVPTNASARLLHAVSIYNRDTADVTATLRLAYAGPTYRELGRFVLGPRERACITRRKGAIVHSQRGAIKRELWRGAIDIGVRSSRAVLTSEQVITSASLVDVPGLSVALTSGRTYYFRALLRKSLTSGCNIAMSGPASSLMAHMIRNAQGATTYNSVNAAAWDTAANSSVFSPLPSYIFGIVKPTANGNLVVRADRNATGGNTQTFHEGSMLWVEEVSA